ncbi:hypothetical protein AKJ16_DCAP23839 [Drosera capensis]
MKMHITEAVKIMVQHTPPNLDMLPIQEAFSLIGFLLRFALEFHLTTDRSFASNEVSNLISIARDVIFSNDPFSSFEGTMLLAF